MTRATPHARYRIALTVLALAGCATPRIDAQFTDPQFAGRSMVGKKVLVVCDAGDIVLKRLCQERFSDEVIASGAAPVLAPDAAAPGSAPAATPDRGLAAARAAGAAAALSATISVDASVVNPGPSIGIGIGGFGGGGRSGTSVGGGISVPIGTPQVTTGYAASGVLTDAATGKLIWTGRAATSPSDNADAQLAELARTIVDAAKQARVF